MWPTIGAVEFLGIEVGARSSALHRMDQLDAGGVGTVSSTTGGLSLWLRSHSSATGLVYSFVTGEYRSSSRFVPDSPKSILATALVPAFSIVTTRPMP